MKRVAGFAFFAAAGLQALFVCAFFGREHTFYFWDHSMYHALARALFSSFQSGIGNGFAALQQSFGENYNVLFALPSLLSFSWFGEGRLVFLLTNFIAFFLAFEAAAAFVLRRLFGMTWGQALLFSAGSCLLVPPLWTPLFFGYPDVGAAACFAMAVGFALMPFEKTRWALAVGIFLGFSFLFRRHFAYPVLAFLIVKACFDFYFVVWRAEAHAGGKALRLFFAYYALCAAGVLGVLAAVAPAFLRSAFSTDFAALHLSYKKPPLVFLRFLSARFGFLLLLASFGGLLYSARRFPETRRGVALLGATALVWAALWCRGPAQAGPHYMLHILPLVAIAGLCGLRRMRFVWILYLALFAGSGWALWGAPSDGLSGRDATPGVFAAPSPPVTRADYDELVALAQYLASTTTPEDRVYAVGSSFVFNQDLLRAVYTDALGRPDVAGRFVFAPEVDSSQSAPLDAFAAATVFAVAAPGQYHLDPAGQKVITAVAQQFPPPPDRADLFSVDERVFSLNNGVKVQVWRRKNWRPAALHDALRELRKTAENARQDWVALGVIPRLFIVTDNQRRTDVIAGFDASRFSLSLFFDAPVSAGDYQIDAKVAASSSCRGVTFALAALDDVGRVVWEKTFSPVVVPGPVSHSFSIEGTSSAFLRLRINVAPFGGCGVNLLGVGVRKQ